jgi:hypothetical protein
LKTQKNAGKTGVSPEAVYVDGDIEIVDKTSSEEKPTSAAMNILRCGFAYAGVLALTVIAIGAGSSASDKMFGTNLSNLPRPN